MPNDILDKDFLAVIGRSLAYLCLTQATKDRPGDFVNLLAKANFMNSLGLSDADAAPLLGAKLNTIQVMRSQEKRRKGGAHGKKK